ncbi:hypothetical protein FRC08_002419 [Ceratobasidium sp. 394]|nr:hypothetical protein FRC08_002419 [Ceratobasidium sp. 394]
MRKSSTSSLRSTTTTTTRTLPTTVSTKKTSVSSVSGNSTPRSGTSTPRSRSMSMGRDNGGGPGTGPATPKQGTPRASLNTPRTSTSSGRNIVSPRPSVTIPRTGTTSPRASPRTPVAPPNKVTGAKVPPARPQRSSLRPGPRSTTVSTSAPSVITEAAVAPASIEPAPLTAPVASAPTFTSTTTSPPRTRATSLDTSPTQAHLAAEGSRPRRTTSISTKPPPLSRSSVSGVTLAPPPMPPMVRARASSRTTSSIGHEDGAVPFPIPESASESEGGLKVPDSRGPKRSLSVSSAARRLVNRARGASPVPSMPTDSVSIVTASSVQEKEKTPKSGRSLSRLAFAALLPKRSANNGAAEAKAALAQAKAREVAEAKARAKAAAEEAKARAKAEVEAKAAEKAAKEPRRIVRRFGSMSKKKSGAVS